VRTALYAEAEALDELQKTVDTVVSNAKAVRESRKSEAEKKNKTSTSQPAIVNPNATTQIM
jgi:hypothetical protein